MRRLIRIIRNLALLLIAAIVILAGVLAFNVVTHGSRQIQVAAVPRVTAARGFVPGVLALNPCAVVSSSFVGNSAVRKNLPRFSELRNRCLV